MPETRHRYDEEFRGGVVCSILENGKPVAQCVRDLGIHEGTLGNWAARHRERGAGLRELSEDERAELNRLPKENTELRMKHNVLA